MSFEAPVRASDLNWSNPINASAIGAVLMRPSPSVTAQADLLNKTPGATGGGQAWGFKPWLGWCWIGPGDLTLACRAIGSPTPQDCTMTWFGQMPTSVGVFGRALQQYFLSNTGAGNTIRCQVNGISNVDSTIVPVAGDPYCVLFSRSKDRNIMNFVAVNLSSGTVAQSTVANASTAPTAVANLCPVANTRAMTMTLAYQPLSALLTAAQDPWSVFAADLDPIETNLPTPPPPGNCTKGGPMMMMGAGCFLRSAGIAPLAWIIKRRQLLMPGRKKLIT